MNTLNKLEESIEDLECGQVYRCMIDRVERILIEKALVRYGGNQLTASKYLGLNRNTLRAKIKRLQIDMEKFRI